LGASFGAEGEFPDGRLRPETASLTVVPPPPLKLLPDASS